MPAVRSPSSSSLVLTRALRFVRFLGTAILVVVVLFCALLLAIRFVVFPNIDTYRDQIAAILASELGQPVGIDAIETGWDGWNPKIAISGLAIRDPANPTGPPALLLPRVELAVAWTSLLVADLRLKELTIERAQLAIRRGADGSLHVAGIEIDPTVHSDTSPATAWLLRQREIVVRDALVTWDDQLRQAPQLVLDRVTFRVEQSFGRLRFGLVGEPPAALASPLEFRGEISASSVNDWRQGQGRFYIQLDYADVALWREWIPLLQPVESGKGALRVWFDVDAGKPTAATADIELTDVRMRFAKELPQLDLAHVGGRVMWKADGGRHDFSAKNLTFRTTEGQELEPATLALGWNEDAAGAITGGALTFDRLEMAPLSALASHLPLQDHWRRNLATYALRGNVSSGKFSWQGPPDAPSRFSGSGAFAQFGFEASEALPGLSGVSGSFTFDETRGDLKLNSRDMRVAVPRVFAEPLLFDTATGKVNWSKGEQGLRLAFDDVRFATPHTSGSANGTWRSRTQGPGVLELKAQLGRAEAPHLYRYLPLTLDAHVRDWLRLGITRGTATEVKIALAGDLAQFPFADPKRGQFQVSFKVGGASLDYADGWPVMNDIVADVKFEGTGLRIEVSQGRILGAHAGPVTIEIPDLGVEHPVLSVAGEANGSTAEFLAFIAQSPVAGWTGHFSDGAEAAGNGKLAMQFSTPLGKQGGTKVAGTFDFDANALRLPGIPPLTQVNGRLAFTEQSMQARDLSAEVLGGPSKINITSGDGPLRIAASGTAQLAIAKRELALPLPLQHRVTGTADWQLDTVARGEFSTWTLTSSLQGTAIDLPAPIGKLATESVPLKVERREVAGRPNEDLLTVDFGTAHRALVHRVLGKEHASVDRALLLLGNAVARGGTPDRGGIWVRGNMRELDLDEWMALYFKESASPTGAGPGGGRAAAPLEVNGIELETGRMDIFGRMLNDLTVTALRSGGDDWRLRLAGREVEGTAVWRAPGPNMPNGRVMARLARFVPPGPDQLHPARSEVATDGRSKNTWPELDIVADSFVSRTHDLGRFELLAQPSGPDWNITRMALVNPAGRIDASGWWRIGRERQTTEMDVTVLTEDAGRFLDRFGYPVAVKNAPTRIGGKLDWAGAPNDFDYPTLSGTFKLTTGAGQFTKMDPGIGRLLGVLSLQALPRRMTLDFRDVFSEGFAFDGIVGDFRIQKGLMHTDNLALEGPAASVRIIGDIDLAAETQRLDVRVQPALSSSLSAGAAVLFLANPIVGAAVGAGTFLAQKLLNNPIEQMFSYEYRVTGPWSDPQVERVGRLPQGPASTAAENAVR